MIRLALLLIVVFSVAITPDSSAQAQDRFTLIEPYVKSLNIGRHSLEAFTREVLMKESQTELEKAWAIYVWITDNITYDCRAYHKNKATKIKYASEEDLAKKLAKLEEKELHRTVRLQRGVCEDYAQLFQAMCSYVGIEAEIITGYGRTSYRDIGRRGRSANHAWNRFRAGGQWYLVDATWGAGYTDAGVRKFTPEFRPAYFMMPPEDMIKNHYPDKPEWQQLAQVVSREWAAQQAIYHYAYWRYGVKKLTPNTGFIKGRSIRFELELDTEVDAGKLAVVQDGLIIHQGFTKQGTVYSAEVSLKRRGKRRIMLGVRKGKKQFDTIIEYRLQ